MASQAFLAGLVCLTLPETKDRPTEETMSPSDVKEVVAAHEMEIQDLQQEKPLGEKKQERDEKQSDNTHRIEVAERDKQEEVKANKQEIGHDNTAF